MTEKDKVINAAEVLGGYMLRWAVGWLFTFSPTAPTAQNDETLSEPNLTASPDPADEDEEGWNIPRVQRHLEGVDKRTLREGTKDGYFPSPARYKGRSPRWDPGDWCRWEAWRLANPNRSTHRKWLADPDRQRFE